MAGAKAGSAVTCTVDHTNARQLQQQQGCHPKVPNKTKWRSGRGRCPQSLWRTWRGLRSGLAHLYCHAQYQALATLQSSALAAGTAQDDRQKTACDCRSTCCSGVRPCARATISSIGQCHPTAHPPHWRTRRRRLQRRGGGT